MIIDVKKILKEKGKAILLYVISMISLALMAKWEWVVDTFDEGKNLQEERAFNGNIIKAFENDSVKTKAVDFLMSDPKFAEKIINHPVIQGHIDVIGQEMHDKIVENVTKNDSNKVSMRSFVGMEAGIRDEQVLPIISEIVKAWDEGQITTKKDVGKILNRYQVVNGKLVKVAHF